MLKPFSYYRDPTGKCIHLVRALPQNASHNKIILTSGEKLKKDLWPTGNIQHYDIPPQNLDDTGMMDLRSMQPNEEGDRKESSSGCLSPSKTVRIYEHHHHEWL